MTYLDCIKQQFQLWVYGMCAYNVAGFFRNLVKPHYKPETFSSETIVVFMLTFVFGGAFFYWLVQEKNSKSMT